MSMTAALQRCFGNISINHLINHLAVPNDNWCNQR